VLGTNLAEDLRSRNFEGLILIRSANSTKEDVAGYMRTGAVDGCLGKDQGSKELVADICAAFRQKQESCTTSLGLQQQPTSQAGGLRTEEEFSSDLFAACDTVGLRYTPTKSEVDSGPTQKYECAAVSNQN
jgi:DNA-binding response OmpR family regulator